MKKSKKILAGVMAVCLMGSIGVVPENITPAVSMTASAETEKSGTCGENLTWVLDNNGTLTISGTGDMEDYAPPTWSSEGNLIKKVIIEDGVTSIGKEAFTPTSVFSEYENLTEVIISDSVTSIGDSVFSCCSNLKSLNVSENNEVYSSIDGVLFNKNKTEIICYPEGKNESSYVIPESVTSIGDCAFYRCLNLTEIIIPDSVTSIGNGAFWFCTNLKEIIIPDSVTSIGYMAFESCTSLTEITIPESVISIGDCAFYNCSNLTEIIIPNSVSIGGYAFYGTPLLNEKWAENSLFIVNNILIDGTACSGDVVIPDGVTKINDQAFFPELWCPIDLTSVTIPDSVTSIGDYAFYGDSNLISITIPKSVKSIGNSAFLYCHLKEITILNPDCEIYDSDDTINNTSIIYGYENSTAQAYAEKYDRKFKSLGEAPKKETATGDANGDNEINISDAVLIMQSISNPSEYTLTEAGKKSADVVDGDGITNKDALAIQMTEAKLLNVEDFPITSADIEKLM